MASESGDTPPQEVIGYHGTSISAASAILSSGFEISRNAYDWLGDGVYFFQDAPGRAESWARKRFPADPAILKSRILLRDCMDLLDSGWSSLLNEAHDEYIDLLRRANLSIPRQTTGEHCLDREVINYSVKLLAEKGTTIRVVRGALREGQRLFPNSALFGSDHIQIAVRDVGQIIETILL